jgi:hypothetical protein
MAGNHRSGVEVSAINSLRAGQPLGFSEIYEYTISTANAIAALSILCDGLLPGFPSHPDIGQADSPTSYFGTFGTVGGINDEYLEIQINDLRTRRLNQSAFDASSLPSTNPTNGPSAARLTDLVLPLPHSSHLRVFVALRRPSPHICHCGGATVLVFGMKADLPGRMALIADDRISSSEFEAADEGTRACRLRRRGRAGDGRCGRADAGWTCHNREADLSVT